MMEPAIKNWQSQPPAGGWGFTYTLPNGQKHSVPGVTAKRVIDQLTDILKLNGLFISDAHVWAIANEVWTRRDPHRAIKAVTLSELPTREELVPMRQTVGKQHHWDTKPERYGPQLWLWLNVFGMVFDKALWDATIKHIHLMLDPKRSPSTGCIKCYTEFHRQCLMNPPDNVNSEGDAAAWVFEVHNAVRIKLDQPPVTWKWAAKQFAWKVSLG